MTPTMDAGAPAATDAGLMAGIDNAFDTAPEPSTDSAAPETAQQPAAGDEDWKPLDAAEGDKPADAADQAEDPDAEKVAPPDGEDDLEISLDRNHYQVKPQRMKDFVAAKNFANAVADYAPTVEAAKQNFESASDFRAMQVDFASGDPAKITGFLDYWGSAAPEGVQALAQNLPAYLAGKAQQGDQMAAQTLQNIEGQVHQVTIDRAYQRALQTGDPDAFRVAQNLDYAITGKFAKTPEEIGRPQQQRQDDPVRTREQQLLQRENAFATTQWTLFERGTISQPLESAVTEQINQAFKAVEGAYNPHVLKALKATAKQELTASLQSNIEAHRNHEVEMADIQRDFLHSVRTGRRTELAPRAQALVAQYNARAARLLPGIVKPLIADATASVVKQNQAAHARAQQAQGKVAPAPGAPAQRSIVPELKSYRNIKAGIDELFGG